MPDFLQRLFSSDGFMPHGHCYMWNPGLVWLHVVSDALIALAYTSIPFTLVYIARRRRDVPFGWMFFCFGTFIIACGATHVMEIWTLWTPTYWLSGAVKGITAAASVPTAALLVKLAPQALAIPTADQLSKAHEELRKAHEALESRVEERTAELSRKNEELSREIVVRKRAEEAQRRSDTERKRVEAAVRESEARKAAVMEAALDAVVMMDHRGVIAEFNPAAEKTFGYTSAEAIGKPLVDLLVPPPLRHEHTEGLRRYLDTGIGSILGKRIEVSARKRDGTVFPAEVAVVRILSEGSPMFTGYIRDITERRQAAEAEGLRRAKEAAEEANSLLNAVIEGTSDAVYVKDREGRFLLMNTPGAALCGLRPSDMVGQATASFLPDDRASPSNEQDRLVMSDGVPRTCESTVTMAGEERTFLVTNGPRRDAEGKITGLIGIAREITDRIRAENELRRSKEAAEMANNELEAFSYSVAHDLRAPLRAINGFSSVLAADHADKLDGEAMDHLSRITSGAERMAGLIDALLALSRLTRTEIRREQVDLTQMARKVMDQLQSNEAARNAEVVVTEGLMAEGDPHLLRALLENLLGNAWKFTSKRTRARVEFGREDLDGEPVYFVRDNGAGFNMAYANKLFAPFRRLHSGAEFDGTGIGLATVQRIVRRHGGRVWAEGVESQGATFRFTLSGGRPAPPPQRT